MSSVKEPYYFARNLVQKDDPILKPITDKEQYLALFKRASNKKVIGEASVHYLADSDAPKLIHEVSPSAKILISLRDPVERQFSEYLMLYSRGLLKKSFREEIDNSIYLKEKYIESYLRLNSGLYSENITNYIDIFGKENIKIIIFEEWRNNPKTTLENILKFLNINWKIKEFTPEIFNKYEGNKIPRGYITKYILQNEESINISKYLLPKKSREFIKKILMKQEEKPKMNDVDRKFLQNYYHNDVEKLKKILKRELPWKNFSNTK